MNIGKQLCGWKPTLCLNVSLCGKKKKSTRIVSHKKKPERQERKITINQYSSGNGYTVIHSQLVECLYYSFLFCCDFLLLCHFESGTSTLYSRLNKHNKDANVDSKKLLTIHMMFYWSMMDRLPLLRRSEVRVRNKTAAWSCSRTRQVTWMRVTLCCCCLTGPVPDSQPAQLRSHRKRYSGICTSKILIHPFSTLLVLTRVTGELLTEGKKRGIHWTGWQPVTVQVETFLNWFWKECLLVYIYMLIYLYVECNILKKDHSILCNWVN